MIVLPSDRGTSSRRRSRSIPAGALATLIVAIGWMPGLARAQITADFGPRGEIRELRVGDLAYLQDVAVSVIKPNWAGTIVDQRNGELAAVRVERSQGATVYSATLTGEGHSIRLRETAHISADKVALEYEITPEQTVDTEVVLLQGTMPAAIHAGKTSYLVIDGGSATRGTCPAELNNDSYIVFGGVAADWIGFTRPGGSGLRVTPGQVSLQFQDNRKWSTPAFALLATGAGGRLAAGKPIRFTCTFAAEAAVKLEADARDAGKGGLAGMTLTDHRPLSIRAVALDKTSVETYEPMEATADIAATYDNPFDPDKIAVDAEVTDPAGRTIIVPGFYGVTMRVETIRQTERLVGASAPGFRVRYTPVEDGKHRLVLKATDRSGSVRSAPLELMARPGRNPGFIRVAKDSPRYFAFESGRPYFAVGENICWSGPRTPLSDYAAWLKGLGAAGGNWARLWLAFNEKGLEWMPAPTPRPGTGHYLGLGRYALDNAWRLDEVLRMARNDGIYLMFCLGTYGEFTESGYFNEGSWVSNPYNARNGGPCDRPADFWTNPRRRQLYKRRLRYLIARWGYSPNLFAWEFWNEMPVTPEYTAWVSEMAAYVKQTDPNRHLVSTTYGDEATWKVPDVDLSMTHLYGQAGNTADFTRQIEREAHQAERIGKPYLLAEFGIDWQTGDQRWDPKGTGLNMHNGAWAALMSGAAGTSMLWYWDSYVHPRNTYHVLTPVRKFADTIDWTRTHFRPIRDARVEASAEQIETFSDLTIPANLEWGTTPSRDYTVGRDGTIQGGPVAMTIGSPARGNPTELHSQLNWHLDLPEAGKITARVGEVCSRAHLRIAVDGQVKLDRELPAGGPGKGPWKSAKFLERWKVWVSDYDEEVAIDVPAGRHVVTFSNTAGDWLQMRALTLPRYRSSRFPKLDVVGLESERLLLLWLHNAESTWRTEYDSKSPTPLKSLRAIVPAASGSWRVEWWDTFSGAVIRSETVPSASGRLNLAVPDLKHDFAARVERVR